MQHYIDIALDVLADAALDTLYLLPFLFVTYLFMEWIEHKTGERAQQAIGRAGLAGPAIGALLGVVPQCGFSAAASTLYAGRIVTLGTLYAVFLSTSDEMLPIFIAEQVPIEVLVKVLAMKVALGMAFGFAVDFFLRLTHRNHVTPHIHELCEHDGCACESEGDHSILRSAAKHTAQVIVFIFLVSLALDIVIEVIGEEALADVLGSNDVLAVVGSAIVGLIPNCAASVAIAELYVAGVLDAGAMMAGLLSAAGIGLLVLLRTNRRPAENARIVAGLVMFSAFCGLVIDACGIAF